MREYSQSFRNPCITSTTDGYSRPLYLWISFELLVRFAVEEADLGLVFEPKRSQGLFVIVHYPFIVIKIDNQVGRLGSMRFGVKL